MEKLTEDQLEEYETTFRALMKRTYSWDLWEAAYIVHGGGSDDAFEYFRCWLVSKGRDMSDRVSADPNSLADLLAPRISGVVEFEEFAYVA